MERQIEKFIVNPVWKTKYCDYDDKFCLIVKIYENFPENYGIFDIDLGKKIDKTVDDFFKNNPQYKYLSHYQYNDWEQYDDGSFYEFEGLKIPTGVKIVYIILAVKVKDDRS